MGNLGCGKDDDIDIIGPVIGDNNNQNNNENNNQSNNDNSHNVDNDKNNKLKDKIKKNCIWVWIDPSVENTENQSHYNILFKNNNINCLKFDNVDEAYNHIIDKYNNFEEIIIIISGKLFINFYLKTKENINNIKFSPTIIIFTRDEEICRNQLKMNNIYNSNNDLFDTQYIFSTPKQIEKFMTGDIPEDNDITFDIINYLDQLIIPNYYSYLLEDVNKPEIYFFNDFLKRKFITKSDNSKENKIDLNSAKNLGNTFIQEKLKQIENKKLPKEIILKYWLWAYSAESEFYDLLNKSLRKKDKEMYFYYPFIKLCYEGIRKGFLKSYYQKLYRASQLNKNEFIKIQKINNKNIDDKKKFPNIIVFSRSFLSFTTDKKVADRFKRRTQETFCILYIINEIQNKEDKISNASIEEYSNSETEKEVLVFPFSCFEIVKINDKPVDPDYDYEIELKYLGNYTNYIKEQFGTNFFDQFQLSKYSQELMNSGLLSIENFFSSWTQKQIFKIKMEKVCFFLDGQEDCISFKNNEIYVFNIYSCEIKQKLTIHEKEIFDIVKLTFNRICSSSKDYTIKIIKIIENNKKYEVNHVINTNNNYAIQILFFQNENILFFDSKNIFQLYEIKDNKYSFIKCIKEDDDILTIKNIIDEKVVYITKDMEKNKKIKFIDLKEGTEEQKSINIEEKEKKLELIDLLIFYDYILVCFNSRIDIINYKDKSLIISFEYFNYNIVNAMILSSNRIILGYYDSYKNKSIIREHLLRIEDLQNKDKKFYCIGQGILESEKIENIIKINESQILTNIKSKNYIIYERINKISEKLKKKLKNLNLNEEIIKEVKENNMTKTNENNIVNNIEENIDKNNENNIKNNIENNINENNENNIEEKNINNFENNIEENMGNNKNKIQEGKSLNQPKKDNCQFINQPPPIEKAYLLFLQQKLKPVNTENKYNFINNMQYSYNQMQNNNNTNIINTNPSLVKNNNFINVSKNPLNIINKNHEININNNKNFKEVEKKISNSSIETTQINSSQNSIDEFLSNLPNANDKKLIKNNDDNASIKFSNKGSNKSTIIG